MMPLVQSKIHSNLWFGSEIGYNFCEKIEKAYAYYTEYANINIQIHSVPTYYNVDPYNIFWNNINILTYYPVSNTIYSAMAIFQIPLLRLKFNQAIFSYTNLYITSVFYSIIRLGKNNINTFEDLPFVSVLKKFKPKPEQQEFMYEIALKYVKTLENDVNFNTKGRINKFIDTMRREVIENFPYNFNDSFKFTFSQEIEENDCENILKDNIVKAFNIVYFNDLFEKIDDNVKYFPVKFFKFTYVIIAKIDNFDVQFSVSSHAE